MPEFYANNIATALEECQKSGNRALFVPEIVDRRIKAKPNEPIWHTWYCTPSITVTGKTSQGSAVVLYVHIPNYSADPKNITETIGKKLVNGAGKMPRPEFERLIALAEEEGDSVFIIPHERLKGSKTGLISIDDALNNPQTAAFLGGEKRAKEYLKRHQEVYKSTIGTWYHDDLCNEPVWRFLQVDCSSDDGFYSVNSIDRAARFLCEAAKAMKQEKKPDSSSSSDSQPEDQ